MGKFCGFFWGGGAACQYIDVMVGWLPRPSRSSGEQLISIYWNFNYPPNSNSYLFPG